MQCVLDPCNSAFPIWLQYVTFCSCTDQKRDSQQQLRDAGTPSWWCWTGTPTSTVCGPPRCTPSSAPASTGARRPSLRAPAPSQTPRQASVPAAFARGAAGSTRVVGLDTAAAELKQRTLQCGASLRAPLQAVTRHTRTHVHASTLEVQPPGCCLLRLLASTLH